MISPIRSANPQLRNARGGGSPGANLRLVDGYSPVARDRGLEKVRALVELARTAAPRSSARTAVEEALAALEEALGRNTRTADSITRALAALQGYADHVRAIDFDRPDRDVSGHARALRSQARNATGHGAEAQQHHAGTGEAVERMEGAIRRALERLPEGSRRARARLEQAAADTEFLQQHSMSDLGVTLRIARRRLGPDVDPYLTEVEQDAPGRDVGRHADNIGALFADGELQYRYSRLGTEWVERSLGEIRTALEEAGEELG